MEMAYILIFLFLDTLIHMLFEISHELIFLLFIEFRHMRKDFVRHFFTHLILKSLNAAMLACAPGKAIVEMFRSYSSGF